MEARHQQTPFFLKTNTYDKKKFYEGNIAEKVLASVHGNPPIVPDPIKVTNARLSAIMVNRYSRLETLIGRLSDGTISGTNLPSQKK